MFTKHSGTRPNTLRALTGAATAVVVLLSTGAVSDAGSHTSYHGVFNETAVGAGLGYDIHGSAKMTVGTDSTEAKVTVTGLDSGKLYSSHLHDGTCSSLGGGHYQDAEGGPGEPPNELWLTNSGTKLVSNKGGVAHGAGSAAWAAQTTNTTRTNARSVIVHEPVTGQRIACADLT